MDILGGVVAGTVAAVLVMIAASVTGTRRGSPTGRRGTEL